MFRTTIMLPVLLKRRAEAFAHEKGSSLGKLMREALEFFLMQKSDKNQTRDPLFMDHAVCDKPCPPDISVNHDQYLYEELERDLH